MLSDISYAMLCFVFCVFSSFASYMYELHQIKLSNIVLSCNEKYEALLQYCSLCPLRHWALVFAYVKKMHNVCPRHESRNIFSFFTE